jgi:hypothetical protein
LLDSEKGSESCIRCLGLDLDVRIPQWMKDNFAKGIYPTLQQRIDIAKVFCDYVEEKCQEEKERTDSTLVSFSFVNTDLRDVFRERFPHAEWVLVDTSEEEANYRISQREGHFYVGKTSGEKDTEQEESKEDDQENSEWDFAPVEYPHDILNGDDPVETNAKLVSDIVKRSVAKKLEATKKN